MAMIPFNQAYATAMNAVRPMGVEHVDIDQARGRILAEDVRSDMDMPPFNKSAMDGYACRREDLDNELTVLETIPAGREPTRIIGSNECSKIMTGAMVPEGADCVVMVEYTMQPAETTMRFTGDDTADNICRRGEDIHAGDIVLTGGERIMCQHIAVLASVGCTTPLVACRPLVGVIATGNELVEPGTSPGTSQIRNSNSYQLCAQVSAAGATPQYYGIAEDTEQGIDELVKKAMAENDVILLSGGVSAGEFDLVPGILQQNGFRLLFEKVAIKPGMPTVFGMSANTFCFGMPGNPVSTFVIFDVLVKPFLHAMMGYDGRSQAIAMRLEKKISRRKTERASWIPVRITIGGEAAPIDYHGSAHVNSLCGADGLVCMDTGVAELAEGTVINVRLL